MSPFDVEIKHMKAINRERYSSILLGILVIQTSMDKKHKEQQRYNIAAKTDNDMNEKGAIVTTQPVVAAKRGVQVQAFCQNFLKTPVEKALDFQARVFGAACQECK
jgi:hypothetical protein